MRDGIVAAVLSALLLLAGLSRAQALTPESAAASVASGPANLAGGAVSSASAAGSGQPAALSPAATRSLRLDPVAAELVQRAWQGFERGDPKPAMAALPALRGSPLEDWVAYWALAPRLQQATPTEYAAYAQAWPHTLPLRRLRAQWLAELGRRKDWNDFLQVYPSYDGDDAQLQCLAAEARFETTGRDTSARVLSLWDKAPSGGSGCNSAAQSLLAAGHIDQQALWRRMRGFFASGQTRTALDFTRWLMPADRALVREAADDPVRVALRAARRGVRAGTAAQRAVVLALLRMARDDPQQAMRLVDGGVRGLRPDERGQIAWLAARTASAQLLPDAAAMFRRARIIGPGWQPAADDWQWCLRAALRASDWALVRRASANLLLADADDSGATYWQAVALSRTGHARQARQLWLRIARPWDYYGQLATEALGRDVRIPQGVPPAPDAAALRAQESRRGIREALMLYQAGAYAPAAWQWVDATRGADDEQLHAAAQLACSRRAWLLCISASDRMTGGVDWRQRYVMPFRHAVASASRDSGVGEAFIYGIMRQESRFTAGIRSWAGADGLMQLMPATARWVAGKIGLAGFQADAVTQVRTNVTLGSAYLGMLLRRFDGSQAMAAAGYNAGPGRPARWRGMQLPGGDALDGAIFTESIPIEQTRDYVKHVLANATVYAVLLGDSAQSLESRLALADPDQISGARQMP